MQETQSLYIMVGMQGSTKSTYVKALKEGDPNLVVLSRDAEGGSLADLLPKVEGAVVAGKSVVIDNTHLTREIRKPFIEIGKKYGVRLVGVYMNANMEDCQIRALHRVFSKYKTLFMNGVGLGDRMDPHVFKPAVLFSARKNLEPPTAEEGFDIVNVMNVGGMTWDTKTYKNKALFLDIDGTIRDTENLEHKYPVKPDDIVPLVDPKKMREVLDKYRSRGYKLIGVSNQSGVAKGVLTEYNARKLMNKTREMLGYTDLEFPIYFCPHQSVPVSCYCRKPQSGLGVLMIEQHELNPAECIMVGDQKTDETFAKRLGFKKFHYANEFWASEALII
jgi:HAD superfamily hydrolase (TIGR01662 family)